MKTIGIENTSDCQASDVTALHLNLCNGVDALIEQVKSLIQNCKDLDKLCGSVPFKGVELDVCLYETSKSESEGWKPKYHRLSYSPSDSKVYIVTQCIEGGYSSDSWLESNWIDLEELLAYLSNMKQAA